MRSRLAAIFRPVANRSGGSSFRIALARSAEVGPSKARCPESAQDGLLDQGAIGQADVRIGVDPFTAQPFHLRAALVEFDDAVDWRRGLIERGVTVLLLASRYGHMQTILSTGFGLSSARAGCDGVLGER